MNVKVYRNFVAGLLFLGMFSLVGCERVNGISTTSETLPQKSDITDDDKKNHLSLSDHNKPCTPGRKKIEQSSCKLGYFCVPNATDPKVGACLKDCGGVQNEMLIKRDNMCPAPLKCMLIKNSHSLPVGMFCHEQQIYPDMPCEAAHDDNACSLGLTCLPTLLVEGAQGATIARRLRCKQECTIDNPCSGNETCLVPSYSRKERQVPKDGDKKIVSCSVRGCAADDPSCACDKARGFFCQPFMEHIDFGSCMRTKGICGKPVPLGNSADFRGKTYLGTTCNELNDNRICASFPHQKSSILPFCKRVGRSSEGICVARCTSSIFTTQSDGMIAPNETRKQMPCPENFSCRSEVSRKIGLFDFVMNQTEKKACKPENCQESQPCPSECGGGDIECVAVKNEFEQGHFCGAPVGTCEAAANP